jgi:hypothetical protein
MLTSTAMVPPLFVGHHPESHPQMGHEESGMCVVEKNNKSKAVPIYTLHLSPLQ